MAHLLKLIVRSVQLYFIESSGPVFVFALFNFQDPTRLSFLRRLARISIANQSVNPNFTNLVKFCFFRTLHKKKAIKSSFLRRFRSALRPILQYLYIYTNLTVNCPPKKICISSSDFSIYCSSEECVLCHKQASPAVALVTRLRKKGFTAKPANPSLLVN